MDCRKIIEELEKTYPLSIAESWDNSGLLAGRYEKEIQKIYVALDPTQEVICHAIEAGADMLVTHHPMLMQGLKKINNDDFYGKRMLNLIQNDIVYYAMHTNYDIVTMGALASDMLGLLDTEVLETTCVLQDGSDGGFGRVGKLPESMTLETCANLVKNTFQIPEVKVFGDPKAMVSRAALLPGSGKSMVKEVIKKGAEVYISGDFGHHDGIDAADQGLYVIDAGHYGIEHIFIKQMTEELKERFPMVEVLSEKISHPFFMC